jgi:teichuronic acid biosynthesis glycosyltransferase TuaC
VTRTSEECSASAAPRKKRVVHIVSMSCGRQFSGHTPYVFSLLSGWREEDVVLDLWGSSLRPLNIGSGNTDYELAAQLWPPDSGRRSRWDTLVESGRQLAFLVTHVRSFDLAHFHHLSWGTLVSPLLLHLLGKKAVFTMSLSGSDNPSAVKASRRGGLAFSFMRRFDGIVALSPLLAEESVDSGFKNVVCLPNFLLLPQLEHGRDAAAGEKLRADHSIPVDATVLLFVGSVIARKGADLLAESFAHLAPRHKDLWLVVVGPQSKADDPTIDEAFVREVKERLGRAGVASRVVWTGTVRNKNTLAGYYSAADVFVFPTRAEGMPNVLCEAMTAGLPVAATNLPGITDFAVADRVTGFLFPPEDVDALTQATERLISDPVLRAKMGRAARAQSKRFGFEEYCRNLKAFYVKVAGFSRC